MKQPRTGSHRSCGHSVLGLCSWSRRHRRIGFLLARLCRTANRQRRHTRTTGAYALLVKLRTTERCASSLGPTRDREFHDITFGQQGCGILASVVLYSLSNVANELRIVATVIRDPVGRPNRGLPSAASLSRNLSANANIAWGLNSAEDRRHDATYTPSINATSLVSCRTWLLSSAKRVPQCRCVPLNRISCATRS